jgi:hypothetical protein
MIDVRHSPRRQLGDTPTTPKVIDVAAEARALDPHQGYTVPKGIVHRTRAPERTVVLMVESRGVVPTGD